MTTQEACGRVGVLTLQRLGDVLTASRVTSFLARQEHVRSVEVLAFDGSEQAVRLLPGVDTVHLLPYRALKRLQKVQPLAPFAVLRDHVEDIREKQGFDTVVNLTSTRFACLLAPALLRQGGTLVGPHMDDYRRYCATSPSLQYLNAWGTDPRLCVFAHHDLYAHAAGVTLESFDGLLPHRPGRDAPIALHLHSSQAAKDWGDPTSVMSWRGLIGELSRRTGRRLVLLGAPSEKEELRQLAQSSSARVDVACLPLKDTLSLLAESAGLVSVDTVSIHMAALAHCPSVVLRLGPARGRAAFYPGPRALLLDPKEPLLAVADVAATAARHFFGTALTDETTFTLGQRLRVRACLRHEHGFLGSATPPWLVPSPVDAESERCDALWQRAWWQSFEHDEPPNAGLLAALLRGRGPDELYRRERLTGSSARLAQWLWLYRGHAPDDLSTAGAA